MDDAFSYRDGRVFRGQRRHRASLHGSLASTFVLTVYASLKLLHLL